MGLFVLLTGVSVASLASDNAERPSSASQFLSSNDTLSATLFDNQPLTPAPSPFVELPRPPRSVPSVLPAGYQSGQQDFVVVQEAAEVIAPEAMAGLEVPLGRQPTSLLGKVRSEGGRVTLNVKDASLHSVLTLIAQQQGLSIASPTGLDMPVTISLQPTSLENALDAIMAISGCTWTLHNEVIYVTQLNKESKDSFTVQGRVIQVLDLNYISAAELEKVVTAFLSPVGKVFSRTLKKDDQRYTAEQLIVEDLPEYVSRIADFIARTDQLPKQVMVEVRVLQIKLTNDQRHGVNLDAMISSNRPEVWFRTDAFATSTGPAATFSVDGTRFGQLIDLINSTTDSKTLAAPKLMMLNGQESKIQIGQRLAYTTSTTTQTVTVQGVQFLDVGVVLNVTPHIADDGQILLKVQPKVSSGQINPNSDLPEEDTTELATSVMVPDGSGIIIGGLIQESAIERQSKIPWLGDVWLVGRLFQRRNINRERVEVIIALLPKIVPAGSCDCIEGSLEMDRTLLPILTPKMTAAPRPEPAMNDAINQPVRSMRGILQ